MKYKGHKNLNINNDMTKKQILPSQFMWARDWNGRLVAIQSCGNFNPDGDFVTYNGFWICKKSDNADHPDFK